MKNVLLRIEYDGTCFSGWQRQPGLRTVQGELERVLSVLCRMPVSIDGTGRTDAGVHALAQCATFSGEFGIPAARIPKAANDMLAPDRQKQGDIRILSAEEVPEEFHARHSAVGKTYIYRIYNGKQMPVFLRNYRYHVRSPLDTAVMNAAAQAFAGRHDFRAFMTDAGSFQGSTEKEIYSAGVYGSGTDTVFAVTGSGFLYNMVRIMTGTLVDIGRGKLPADSIPEIIESGRRSMAGHTAPPQGLYMAEVYFSREKMLERCGKPFVTA